MINMTLQLATTNERREAIVKLFTALLGPARTQRECISCNLYQAVSDANVLYLEQRWRKQQALEAYIRSGDYRQILVAMEQLYGLPAICFDTIGKSVGLEFIEYIIKGDNHEGG